MNLQEWFDDFFAEIKGSPIRQEPKEYLSQLINKDAELDLILKEANVLKEKMQSTLRVALIGEVKAGKSTLINALVGSPVSPTNILEATSVIWEIGYAETPSTTIFYTNTDVKIVEQNYINKMFISSANSQELARSISKIVVKTHQHNFKQLYLIDTPGLATITTQNANTTRGFLQEADVVLWIFNATHLGQTDVSEEMSKIARLGKPIIGILNRIDEVDDTPERLIRYLNRSAGEYLSDIFPVSAFQAFNAHITKDHELLAKSGIQNLKQFLMESLNKKADAVRLQSLESSCRALARKERELHELTLRSLQFLIEQNKEYNSDLSYDKDRLTNEMLSAIDNEGYHLESSAAVEKQITHIISNNQEAISQGATKLANSLHEQILGQISPIYKAKITTVIEKNSSKLIKRFQEFQEAEGQKLWVDLSLSNTALTDFGGTMMESATKSATIAGSFGLGIAAYGAWVGPYASTLTLAGGLGAVVLPFAIVGLIGGLGIGYYKAKEKKKTEEDLAKATIREYIFRSVITDIKRILSDKIEEDFTAMKAQYITSLCSGFTMGEIMDLHKKTIAYLSKIAHFGLEL
jgi:GTPase Era involved in 16S rRNA processing